MLVFSVTLSVACMATPRPAMDGEDDFRDKPSANMFGIVDLMPSTVKLQSLKLQVTNELVIGRDSFEETVQG